jgi:hypothetical protein
MQEYIDSDEHILSPLDDLAEVMADFPTHANSEQLTIILARRLAAVEGAQATIGKQLVNIVCHKATARDTKAILDSMRIQLDAVEARLARYAMRLAESDVNLQDCMDRISAMDVQH